MFEALVVWWIECFFGLLLGFLGFSFWGLVVFGGLGVLDVFLGSVFEGLVFMFELNCQSLMFILYLVQVFAASGVFCWGCF